MSPFIGRLDDISQDGMTLIRDIVTIFRNFDIKTQVLVTGLRRRLTPSCSALFKRAPLLGRNRKNGKKEAEAVALMRPVAPCRLCCPRLQASGTQFTH